MRNPTRFGFYGLAACMCSFCLSTATGLSQDAKPDEAANSVAGQDSPPAPVAAPSLRQLLEQNQAVLKALEQLREDREAALNRYTQTIVTQLDNLKDAFTLQRGKELQNTQRTNQMIMTLAGALAGLTVLAMLLSALLPLLVFKRFASAPAVASAGRAVLASPSRVSREAPLLLHQAPEHAPTESAPGGAIEQFERRLLALEKRVAPLHPITPKALVSTGKPGSAPTLPEVPAVKPAKAARVAITLGAGEAITFLPREAGLAKLHSFRAFLAKFKKVFRRSLTLFS